MDDRIMRVSAINRGNKFSLVMGEQQDKKLSLVPAAHQGKKLNPTRVKNLTCSVPPPG